MKAVEIKNITKRYGKRTILKDISFSVDEGEFVALIGPSGCGKSTILNMIGALETYDSGEICMRGKKLPQINGRKATMLRRNEINYLFQSFALITDMTVMQNLLLAMQFVGISRREKSDHIDKVLISVNMLTLKNSIVNTLSGGEQQRVALARTMLKPGNLILADEPTGSLDAHSANISFSLIQSLCKEYGKTVMMVTHSPELARRADRIIDLMEFRQGQSQ